MNNELREAYQHALHLHNSGKLQEALPLYERLLPYLNENAHVLYAVGSALAQIGSYGLATVLLHRSVVLDPSNYEAWTNLGLSYRTAGLVDKAIAIYKHVLGMKVP
jgi:tetratricopeptide (TPR) repeat protein